MRAFSRINLQLIVLANQRAGRVGLRERNQSHYIKIKGHRYFPKKLNGLIATSWCLILCYCVKTQSTWGINENKYNVLCIMHISIDPNK